MRKPSPQTGLRRIFKALRYSLSGIREALSGEEAFRQEAVIYLLLLPVLVFLPLSIQFKALLFSANTLVLVVELLNSAIESMVDLASPGYHDLARQAKDMASAAVFISIILALILWLLAFYQLLLPEAA